MDKLKTNKTKMFLLSIFSEFLTTYVRQYDHYNYESDPEYILDEFNEIFNYEIMKNDLLYHIDKYNEITRPESEFLVKLLDTFYKNL